MMRAKRINTLLVTMAALALVSCAKKSSDEAPQIAAKSESAADEPAASAPPAPPADEERARRPSARGPAPRKKLRKLLASGKKDKVADQVGGEKKEAELSVQTRSWFPETFLFRPLVVTDAAGQAEVVVRVPDRLTTWRVLALAHSRDGAQAGSVTSFLGTLPVYVEPVVPPVLRAGDVVRLPVNLVNTTAAPVTAALKVTAVGAQLTGGAERVTIAASGSAVRHVRLAATRPTKIRLLASLGTADAVVRTVDVIPLGRPVTRSVSGTLAAPRTLQLERAADANPQQGRVRLEVFPGALAILRSELSAATGRGGGLANEAFALLLAGKAPGLMRALGHKPAKAELSDLRDLTMVAMQRVVRRARVMNMTSATLLAEAATVHRDNPVLFRLGQRAVQHIERKQAPDGTCGGASGWTLQRLLVATADCVRAAAGKRKVAVRASGAFERNAERIKDPYTAAAVLSSSVVSDALAARLVKLVLAGIKTRKDGAKVVQVPRGVVRADGTRPGQVEASALAVLALHKTKGAPLADLGAAILAGYSPDRGWGDGRANLVCMQAALRLFRDPIPDKVVVTLSRDGQPVAEQVLTRERLREVLVLEAPAGKPGAGDQQWNITAKPAVPGLGFSLTLTDRVPWKKQQRGIGLELSVTPPTGLTVGRPATLAVRATAPAGKPLSVVVALPAGVQLDRKQLDKLVSATTLTRYKATDAKLTLHAPALPPAKLFAADVRVVPTLAGTLSSGASSLRVSGAVVHLPPAMWTIK